MHLARHRDDARHPRYRGRARHSREMAAVLPVGLGRVGRRPSRSLSFELLLSWRGCVDAVAHAARTAEDGRSSGFTLGEVVRVKDGLRDSCDVVEARCVCALLCLGVEVLVEGWQEGIEPDLKEVEVFKQVDLLSGRWSVVSGQWPVVSGQWSVVSAQCSVLSAQWPVLSAQCSVASGQCSVVSSRWSVVSGQWSVVSSGRWSVVSGVRG